MHWMLLAIIISYLIGSIPTAYLFGRALKGIDIRNFGSGNMGATNALRVLGKRAGVAVLVIDVLKGALPVMLLGDYMVAHVRAISPDELRFLLGIACICGHNWTVFLQFRGGKGVATSLGVLIALGVRSTLMLKVLLGVLSIWLVIFLLSRIVSLASICAGLAFSFLLFFFHAHTGMLLLGVLMSLFIVLRHRTNLIRIFQGTEKCFSFSSRKTDK